MTFQQSPRADAVAPPGHSRAGHPEVAASAQTAVVVVVESTGQPRASCAVCGATVAAGEGLTAVFRDRVVRLRCIDCLVRFTAAPERYLVGTAGSCCGGEHDQSPASEWPCD